MYRRIRDLREDSDLTQKSLADYLSCSQVCYSNYETGKRDVPSDVLIRLARFYHTSVDYLVGLTEERDRKSTRLNSSHRLESRMPSSA